MSGSPTHQNILSQGLPLIKSAKSGSPAHQNTLSQGFLLINKKRNIRVYRSSIKQLNIRVSRSEKKTPKLRSHGHQYRNTPSSQGIPLINKRKVKVSRSSIKQLNVRVSRSSIDNSTSGSPARQNILSQGLPLIKSAKSGSSAHQ